MPVRTAATLRFAAMGKRLRGKTSPAQAGQQEPDNAAAPAGQREEPDNTAAAVKSEQPVVPVEQPVKMEENNQKDKLGAVGSEDRPDTTPLSQS